MSVLKTPVLSITLTMVSVAAAVAQEVGPHGNEAEHVFAGKLDNAADGAPSYYNLGPSANVSGLSADGSVASGYITAGPFFYWTAAGGQVFVGGIGPGDGVGGSAAISDDGACFSGNTIDPNTQLSEMSRYHIPTGTWELLGGVGSSSGVEGSSGWGISGNGQSVVGLGWINGGTAHAIQWIPPGPTHDLGSTVANNSSRANATNFDGSIVVGWQDNRNGRQAALWNEGMQTLLFDNIGDPLGEASDVSGDGNWIVGQGGFGEPWRYNRSTGNVDRLGVLDPNASFPSRGSTGVTDDGRTVVGFERDFSNPFGGTFGTIWIEGQGIQDLTTYAMEAGVPIPAGVQLAIPLAISADGSTIAGLDNHFDGFIITVPEPATRSLLLSAMTLIILGGGLRLGHSRGAGVRFRPQLDPGEEPLGGEIGVPFVESSG
ncbi:MAG: hypothetical protein ACOY3P_18975 [Planctomycetota bacterium]